ncbi:VIT family protein [Candidatus Burarchaeum australiense]|nr:VIT family protein [Candidatus Burarchaeum australiense]
MTSRISNFIGRVRRYERITGMSQIARRYFVMNAFDGALTMFGLVVGSYLAGVRNPVLIFTVGISTILAIGISGLWGAFLTETAERKRELHLLEKRMLRKLSSSYIGEASNAAIYLTAAVDAFSPMLAGFLILLPFLLAENAVFGMSTAYELALALSFIIFFGLGAFLGRISKDNWVIYGLKMLTAGLLAALLTYLLSSSGVTAIA